MKEENERHAGKKAGDSHPECKSGYDEGSTSKMHASPYGDAVVDEVVEYPVQAEKGEGVLSQYCQESGGGGGLGQQQHEHGTGNRRKGKEQHVAMSREHDEHGTVVTKRSLVEIVGEQDKEESADDGRG